MQEHFIPQDISNYRFHLIGELDLRQFLEIMAGVVIGFLIYKMGWPGIITWPLIILFVGLGLIAAFVPIADQPLSHWAKVFFHLLSAPTKFYWRKGNLVPAYFTYELPSTNKDALSTQETFNSMPAKQHRALDYFSSLEQKTAEQDHLEIFNQENVESVLTKFANLPVVKNKTAPKKIIRKPSVQEGQSMRIRPVIAPSQESMDSFLNTVSFFKPTKVTTQITGINENKNLGWPQNNRSSSGAAASPAPTPNNPVPAAAPTTTPSSPLPSSSIPSDLTPTATTPPLIQTAASPISQPSSLANSSPTSAASPLSDNSLSPSISPLTTVQPIAIKNNSPPINSNSSPSAAPTASTKTSTFNPSPSPVLFSNSNQPSSSHAEASSSNKSSTVTLTTPTNLEGEKSFLLKGKVVNSTNQSLTDAVLTLKDTNGNLKFVLRSDENGNFISSRPLDTGKYVLTVQKDTLIFPETLLEFTADGLAPLLLKAQ